MDLKAELERYKILLEEERHNFNVLSESNIALNSSKTLDQLLREVLSIMVSETLADRGCLMLINDSGELEVKVRHNIDNFRQEMDENPALQNVIKQVLETGENTCVLDTSIDYRFKNLVTRGGENIHSIICFPLTNKEKVIGAVYVDTLASNSVEMDFSSNKIEWGGKKYSIKKQLEAKAYIQKRLSKEKEEKIHSI